MPATAADIPPELFDLILDSLNLNAYADDEYQRQIAHVTKRDLGMAMLVCRHWAKLCQTKLFEEVTLRSREDVSQLLDLLKSTDDRVARCVRYLDIPTLNDNASTKPYIHLLPSLYSSISSPLTISLHMEGPLRATRGSFRSIHRTLPRTCPALSAKIAHLHISNMHLRSFAELMHVVGELPDLDRLICTKLMWDTPPPVLPTRRLAACTSLREVLISGCTENWAAFLFFAGYKRRGVLHLSSGEVDALVNIVKSVEVGVDNQQYPNSEATINGMVTEDIISISVHYDLMWTGQDDFPAFATALTPSLHVFCHRSADPTLGEVSVITIDFRSPGPYHENGSNCDWIAFDQDVAGLSHLQKVVLGFPTKESLGKFFESGADVLLSRLAAKRLLKYAVRDKRDVFWKRLTAELDVVESSEIDELRDVW